MPCWTGKGCWTQAARPICVFHFGHAGVMWEARCVKAAPCQHARAVYSALRAFPVLPNQRFICTGFFLALHPLCLGPGEIRSRNRSGAGPAPLRWRASAATTLLPWTPARSCGDTGGFPNVGLAVGLLPWWGVKSELGGCLASAPSELMVQLLVSIAAQCPNRGVAVVW